MDILYAPYLHIQGLSTLRRLDHRHQPLWRAVLPREGGIRLPYNVLHEKLSDIFGAKLRWLSRSNGGVNLSKHTVREPVVWCASCCVLTTLLWSCPTKASDQKEVR